MCGLYYYNNNNNKSTDATKFGYVITLPEDQKTNPFIYIYVIINLIYICINALEKKIAWIYCAYQENMKKIFKQFPTGISTPTIEYFKIKRQTILTDIGGEQHLNNIRNPKPPTKKIGLNNKEQ